MRLSRRAAEYSDMQKLPFDAARADGGTLCMWDVHSLPPC
jgi:hypothetical protein